MRLDDLTLTREKSRKEVNDFLELDEVGHDLGSIQGWKAVFGTRYDNELIAVVVLGRPLARWYDADKRVNITRLAAKPKRPDNTASWLIARARNWAYYEGYEVIAAHAGVAGNHGTVYEASGFELVKEKEESTNTWKSREGRDDYGNYVRRRWEYHFDEPVEVYPKDSNKAEPNNAMEW